MAIGSMGPVTISATNLKVPDEFPTTEQGINMPIPRPLSEGECEFALHCNIYHIAVEREVRFCERHWRFDFVVTGTKIAIEIEGVTHEGGRHQRIKGYMEDARKYNEATLLGWRVFRFTPGMVHSGEAIDMVRAALKTKEN
jgi:very-short-patch-repair endonuclease